MAKTTINTVPTSKTLFGEPVKVVDDSKALKKSAPALFDYINMIFQKPAEFTALLPYEKGKHFFMFNRFFAIQYPIQAQMFNHTRIDGPAASQYWCDSLSRLHSRTPSWIWNTLKATKKVKQEKKKQLNVEEATILEYCKKTMCSKRDLQDAYEFFPDKIQNELIEFEQMLKGSTLKK